MDINIITIDTDGIFNSIKNKLTEQGFSKTKSLADYERAKKFIEKEYPNFYEWAIIAASELIGV